MAEQPTATVNTMDESHSVEGGNPDTEVDILEHSIRWGQSQESYPWWGWERGEIVTGRDTAGLPSCCFLI